MKEQSLIEMKNKVEALTRVTQFVLGEIEHLKTLSMGTYQTIKEMPGYEEAIAIMTERVKNEKPEVAFDPDLEQVPG